MLGKIPGQRGDDKLWRGFWGSWSVEFRATQRNAIAWHHSGASVGLQGRQFPGLDIDVEDEKFAKELTAMAVEHIGDAPIRWRRGSPRVLLMFKLAAGHDLMRKRRVAFTMPKIEGKQACELLASGQQYVVEGPHPKGDEYRWRNDHPCKRGVAGIPEITKEQADAFFAALRDLLGLYDCHSACNFDPLSWGIGVQN